MALEVYRHGRRDDMRVALTFDDGPNPPRTDQILEILGERGARASFFVVGKWVERWPTAFLRIVEGRHVIGNHSHLHQANLGDYDRAEATIGNLLGRPTAFLRAPYLDVSTCLKSPAATAAQMKIVDADVNPADYERTEAQAIVDATLEHPSLAGGSIINLHDGVESEDDALRLARPLPMIEALSAIIDGLRAKGFELVGLDEMELSDPIQWRPDEKA